MGAGASRKVSPEQTKPTRQLSDEARALNELQAKYDQLSKSHDMVKAELHRAMHEPTSRNLHLALTRKQQQQQQATEHAKMRKEIVRQKEQANVEQLSDKSLRSSGAATDSVTLSHGMPNMSGKKLMDTAVQFRAISLEQLRKLRSLVQSLCKCGMLKDPFNNNAPLAWAEVNMHHICHQIIKKVISSDNPCSWVESQATTPQRPTYFVTHNWSEPFRDFMEAIDLHAAQCGVRLRQTYWICVFAINQFVIDMGDPRQLETSSPFICALKEASAAVLMLDKKALTLRRIWCLLEIFVVLTKHVELLGWTELQYDILTPVGVIGSKSMSSSPLNEALRNANSMRSEASFAQDRRLILNYVAFGAKEDGLLRGLAHDAKRNSLELRGVERDAAGELAYEASLFEEHRDQFHGFDAKIRACVGEHTGTTLESPSVPKSIDMLESRSDEAKKQRPPVHLRGITLANLRVMAIKLEAEAWTDKAGAPIAWDKVSIYDFERKFMATMERSWQETHAANADRPAPPEWQIGCTFGTPMVDFFQAIEWHAEARKLPDTTVYWTWATSLTQQDIKDWFGAEQAGTPARDVIPLVHGTLNVVVRGVELFKRINPLEELNNSFFKTSTLCDLGCSTGVIAASVPFTARSYEFGTFDVSLCREMLGVRTLDCTANTEAARNAGLNRIAETPVGGEPPLTCSQYNRLDQKVHRLASGPALRVACFEGDLAEVQRIIELASPNLKSFRMCSDLGSSPLMVAAAAGHVKIMEWLVQHGASVHMDDSQSWAALHYAAFAGQLEAVQYLLSRGCSMTRTTTLEETPIDLARANPAWFCGVDTRETLAELLLAQHKLTLLTINMQYMASWPKEQHAAAVARLGSILRQDPTPDVICVQEGLHGTDVFSHLGYDLVASSATTLPSASQSVYDMVYGDAGAIADLDEATRQAKLTNEVYLRRGCLRWDVVDSGVDIISSGAMLKGGDGRKEGKLAVRSVAWVNLQKAGDPDAPHVFVLCTHVTGGRFEDQYYLQSLQSERAEQVPRAMAPFYTRCTKHKDLGLLVGDFNATPTYNREDGMHKYYDGAIKTSEGVRRDARAAGLDDEQMVERFKQYMISPFAAIAEQGWKLAYDPLQVGPTSAYGQTVDHVATSRVCTTHVEKFFTTNQRFGKGEPDTDLVVTDHNAIKITIELDRGN